MKWYCDDDGLRCSPRPTTERPRPCPACCGYALPTTTPEAS